MRATYADLERVPENRLAQIVDGTLYATRHGAPQHAAALTVVGASLLRPFSSTWRILNKPEVHLGPDDARDVLVPDVAGWQRHRVPDLPETHFTIAFDWVCEVLAEDTEVLDRIRKLPIYRREGVRHVWLISPKNRTLEVFRNSETGWVVVGAHQGADKVHAEPFEAFEFNLAHLWPAPASPTP